ncbi:hypothetical protein OG613_48050 (plasmid) [Streptomyces sp. NBC_00015]|uniref:hypothetical protein n=1 Tax=Streptomyces sp. NBC_00015 TaxID=2903611 RepID=UPI002F90E5CE
MTTDAQTDIGHIHELVDAVREQAGITAEEPYRIPGAHFTPPKPTPTPQQR